MWNMVARMWPKNYKVLIKPYFQPLLDRLSDRFHYLS